MFVFGAGECGEEDGGEGWEVVFHGRGADVPGFFCALALNEAAPYSVHMPTVALQAHYDGEKIVLDEPFDLPVHASLIVTVLPTVSEPESDTEEAWLRVAVSSDAFAFLADPAEDVYNAEDGEPFRDAV